MIRVWALHCLCFLLFLVQSDQPFPGLDRHLLYCITDHESRQHELWRFGKLDRKLDRFALEIKAGKAVFDTRWIEHYHWGFVLLTLFESETVWSALPSY